MSSSEVTSPRSSKSESSVSTSESLDEDRDMLSSSLETLLTQALSDVDES